MPLTYIGGVIKISTIKVMRNERKFEISEITAMKLKPILVGAMGEDENNGEDGYLVRSLYFDSIHDDDFFDKEDGLEKRKKIRLRTYNPANELIKLEIKEKIGSNQIKRSLIIDKVIAKALIDCRYDVLLKVDEPLAEELYLIMQQGLYRPRTVIEYRRYAYVLSENNTRITIDRDIVSTESNFDIFSDNLIMYPISGSIILEIKYNRFLFDYLKDYISMIEKREVAVSKYLLGRKIGFL